MLQELCFGWVWIREEHVTANGEEAGVDEVIKGFPCKPCTST